MNLIDLPDLILELVACKLSAKEFARLQCVCKTLSSVSKSPTLWQRFLEQDHGLAVKVIVIS